MRLLTCFRLTVLVWAACLVCGGMVMAATGTDAVPSSASVIVRWKTPETSWGRAADLVDRVQPGFGGVVKASLPAAGQWLQVDELKGIDLQQDIWVLLFAEPNAAPSVVFAVTASDVSALKKSLPEGFETHVADKLVVYSDDADALTEVRTRLNGKGESFWEGVDAASRKTFDAADVSVIVNIKQLTEDFEEELKQAEPRLNEFLDEIAAAMPEAQRPQMENIFEMYRKMGGGILACVRDSHNSTVGLTIDESGIRVDQRLQATKDSEFARSLASQPASKAALIDRLPAGKGIYAGVRLDMSKYMQWSMDFTRSLFGEMNDEQSKKFENATKGMANLKYEELAMFFDIGSEAPLMRMGSVTLVTPGEQIKKMTREMLESMDKIHTPPITQSTKLERAVEKIDGVDVDRVTITQVMDDGADAAGVQQKTYALMFGEGGMKQLMMFEPKRTIQMLGGGLDDLRRLKAGLDARQSGESPLIAGHKRQLEKANIVLLADVAKLAVSGIKLASQQFPLPINAAALGDLKLEDSYMGFSLEFESTALKTRFDFPIEQAVNLATIAKTLQSR